MKFGWKNSESTIPVLVHSLFSRQRDRVRGAFLSDTGFVFFAVKLHFNPPGKTGAHLRRSGKFLRRGVEVFLSCGLAFHGVILS